MATADGRITELCPGISSTNILEVSPNVFAIVANDPKAQILNIYLTSAQESCHLVNSVPVSAASAKGLFAKPSLDGQKLLVRRQAQNSDGTLEDLLFYIPLNGRPAFLINFPVFSAATITSFDFSLNSQSVIYSGEQIRPGDSNVFYWTAP